jgi:HSP20 family protein
MNTMILRNSLFSDLEDFFGNQSNMRYATTSSFPKLNLYSYEDENNNTRYVIEASISGYDPNDIDVSIDRNRLVITYDKKEEVNEAKRNYSLQEIKRSSFSRSVLLSDKLDTDNPITNYKDGVLKIEFKEDHKKLPKKINFLS